MKSHYKDGESGNVNIISDSRSAEFAKETLFAISSTDEHQKSMASIHVEKDDSIHFTMDGNPFFGGSQKVETKSEAIRLANSKGFRFDEKAINEFLIEDRQKAELSPQIDSMMKKGQIKNIATDQGVEFDKFLQKYLLEATDGQVNVAHSFVNSEEFKIAPCKRGALADRLVLDPNTDYGYAKEELPFKVVPIIKKESLGKVMPTGMTDACGELLRHANDAFGHLIQNDITIKDFAKLISEHSTDTKAQFLAKELKRVEPLTFVIFSGDHRNSSKTEYKYTVIGSNLDDAEKLLEQIHESEFNKTKYADSKPRRSSFFVGAGGELSSGVIIKKPEADNKSKLKNN